ncbi:MAG TPA: hypothetical protein DEP53_03085 [Bacteroidetes bacterium]|nr:MAG: hypothetical protein A2X66_07435 [Ignavibacteria bacterium GWA2_54_16]HCA78698.1 hypothetical protein [Bacteroidota bacterium]
MQRILRIVLLLLYFSAAAFAQKPDWVKEYGKSISYPEQLYLTGFGMHKVTGGIDRATSLRKATESARGNLIQSVRVSLQSTSGMIVEERNQRISSYFSSATQATSSMEIQGLELKTFYDDDEEMSYALAYVSRAHLASLYKEKESKLRKSIRQSLDAGKTDEEQGLKTKALDEYLACYPLFRQLEEAQAILLAVRTGTVKAIAELEGDMAKDEVDESAIREAVRRLVQRPMVSAEDLAWYLAYCLKEQLNLKEATLLVTPFTYRDTKMGSPFSRFFKQVLESRVAEVARWTPVQQDLKSRSLEIVGDTIRSPQADYILRGTYWERENGIKFISTFQRVSDGKMIGSAEAVIDTSILEKTPLSLKPQNFAAALSDQKQFGKDEALPSGLSLEVWTNKGTDDLVFSKGERMQAYVRVNMPCYIRFIYHLADGKRALLVDNHYIDQSKVNRVYPIPEEFECDEPFGAEFLQAFARTEEFEPVHTQEVEGYKILQEDLERFLASQRGMKKVKRDTLQAETRLVMTTVGE